MTTSNYGTLLDRGPSPYEHMRDVVRANKAAGKFFFSPGAMQFFHCRIESALIRGRYFITSEQMEEHEYMDAQGRMQPPTERRYTVRYAQDDGSIESITPHMQFTTQAEAMTYLLQHDQHH